MSTTMTLPSSVSPLGSLPSGGIMDSLFRMTVDQYERLVDAGVLDGQPIELINGLLVKKMGKNPPHVIACEALRDELLPLIFADGGSPSRHRSGSRTSTSPSPTWPSSGGPGTNTRITTQVRPISAS